MPLRGASGSSVHFAGMHFGTLLHVPLLQTWLGFEEKSVDFVQRKENNAFCTLPDWPGVANLIITSLLVRDWFRTRTRQILGFETKNRRLSKEHTQVFNRLFSKDKECSPLSCWWSAGTVQGIAHGLFGCDLRHRHQHIIIIIIIIIVIIIAILQ